MIVQRLEIVLKIRLNIRWSYEYRLLNFFLTKRSFVLVYFDRKFYFCFSVFFSCRENIGSPKRRIYRSSLQENTTTEIQNSRYSPIDQSLSSLMKGSNRNSVICVPQRSPQEPQRALGRRRIGMLPVSTPFPYTNINFRMNSDSRTLALNIIENFIYV